MGIEEAIEKYTEMFGSFPEELISDLNNEDIILLVADSLETGDEIGFDEGFIY